MANLRLTKATAETLKPADQTYFAWDEGPGSVRGFGLRVLPNGRRVAVLQYRLKGAGRKGMARRFTIGELSPGLTFSRAKAIAEELRASVVNGGDPVHDVKAKAVAAVERNRLAKERTFKHLTTAWLKKKAGLRSIGELKRIVKADLGELNARDVASITYADVETLVEQVQDRAPYMAHQVALTLRSILDLGVRKGWIAVNPATHLELNAPHVSRDRVLTDAELVEIWKAADGIGWHYGRAVQLLILTAARRSEVVGLDWSEIDLDAGLWRLPAARAKNNEAHLIHLSPQTVAVLKLLPDVNDGNVPKRGLVFSTNGKTAFSGFSKPKARLDEAAEVKNWRLHDLRRTAATAMSEMGFSVQVVERVLNHRGMSRSGIVGIYQRSELLSERKVALEAWGKRVEQLVASRGSSLDMKPGS